MELDPGGEMGDVPQGVAIRKERQSVVGAVGNGANSVKRS